jgi:hypothetical protein
LKVLIIHALQILLTDPGSPTTKKVKETPSHILEPNAAYENRKWKGSSQSSVNWSLKDSGPLPDRLLETTLASERSKYQKVEHVPDSRELGWQSYFTKSGKIVIPGPDGQGKYL